MVAVDQDDLKSTAGESESLHLVTDLTEDASAEGHWLPSKRPEKDSDSNEDVIGEAEERHNDSASDNLAGVATAAQPHIKVVVPAVEQNGNQDEPEDTSTPPLSLIHI